VTVIRHGENRGTSGAVITGFRYALANGYDWIWLFDADSAPRKDALEQLVRLYESLPNDTQEQVWLLSSVPMEAPNWSNTAKFSIKLAIDRGESRPKPRHGVVFTPTGYRPVQPPPGVSVYEFDATIWSGSLYRLAAIEKVGLPSADYVLDWGEFEYGYRGRRHGYRAFMHQGSVVDHNITGEAALRLRPHRFGPIAFNLIELAPIRCYYVVRNTLYFWLYVYHVRSLSTVLPRIYKVILLTMNFAVRPQSRRRELLACLRGIRDGVLKNVHRRYADSGAHPAPGETAHAVVLGRTMSRSKQIAAVEDRGP
jgi:rhamnosyltransferase